MGTARSAAGAPPEADCSFDVGGVDTLARMTECFARYGDTYRVHVPARRSYSYVVHHPDDVKRVLVANHRNYTKGVDRDRIKILLGRGLMTSEGEFWTQQRHLMQPLFHRRVITRFAQVIDETNARFADRLAMEAARGGVLNVTEAMSELTLEIVLRAIFGRDFDEMAEAFAVVTREQARNLEFVYKFRAVAKLVGALVRRRGADSREHFDFVAMMMNARDKETGVRMSEHALIDEVMTLVVAGHETTASVLNWAWYLLSQHPQVEASLHAEIAAQAPDTAPSLAQVETLGYAQQVLNETMRLYPPGWLLSRRTIGADVLGGGYEIPPGASVLVPLYLVHRHPRYWQDPDQFQPERFAPEQAAARPRFAFVPFAAGPRHCIGESLALYEMLMHLQRVVPRFRLILVPDRPLELEAQINLRTRHPLMMRIERR